jgi:hypothetical protein
LLWPPPSAREVTLAYGAGPALAPG